VKWDLQHLHLRRVYELINQQDEMAAEIERLREERYR
jgi:hypothetical protein